MSARGERAYVSNEDGNSVSVIDTRTAQVIATIDVGKRPRGMKIDRAGARLFVAVSGLPKCPPTVPDEECAKLKRDLSADGIAIIDTASHKVVRVLAAGSDPEQFDLSADEKRLFVANEDAGRTSVVDIASGRIIASIPVGLEPEGVAVTPNGRWVLVTNESDHAVSVIDTAHAQGGEIRVGGPATARHRLYAGQQFRLCHRRVRRVAVPHRPARRRACAAAYCSCARRRGRWRWCWMLRASGCT